jgi:hypothetical protein
MIERGGRNVDEDAIRCWACRADITEEVTEEVMGEDFCETCVEQIMGFMHDLRRSKS